MSIVVDWSDGRATSRLAAHEIPIKTITVIDCHRCPFEHRHNDPPRRSCRHPGSPPAPSYENIIDVKHGRMPWCPLDVQPVLVQVRR